MTLKEDLVSNRDDKIDTNVYIRGCTCTFECTRANANVHVDVALEVDSDIDACRYVYGHVDV